MIRPLRSAHRVAVVLAAWLLPLLMMWALGDREPSPVNQAVPRPPQRVAQP